MALVTYLLRAVPFVLFDQKIKNRFFRSFLTYIPYTVLSAMTIPAVFSVTGSYISAVAGFVCALILAYRGQGLIVVALGASFAVFIAESIVCFYGQHMSFFI